MRLLKRFLVKLAKPSYSVFVTKGCILGITRIDKKWNTRVRNMTRVVGIVEKVKRLKCLLMGQVSNRMNEKWKKYVVETRVSKSKRRWVDNVRNINWVR